MSEFTTGVVATAVNRAVYEVFCNRCSSTVGTLSFDQVREAIFATLGRGGILCPLCRSATCDVCGLEIPREYLVEGAEGPRGAIRACMGCIDGIAEMMRDHDSYLFSEDGPYAEKEKIAGG